MEQTLAAPSIAFAANVEGSVVVGAHNFVVNTNYGTIMHKQAGPQVRLREMFPRPPRLNRGFVGRSSITGTNLHFLCHCGACGRVDYKAGRSLNARKPAAALCRRQLCGALMLFRGRANPLHQ